MSPGAKGSGGGPDGAAAGQAGFTLIELVLALALTALIAIWASNRVAHRIEDAAARSTGAWLVQVRGAMEQALLRHFDAWAAGQAPKSASGASLFTDSMAPTLDELRRAGALPAGFPLQSALGFGVRIGLLRTATCPGQPCRLDALIYTDKPLLKTGTHYPDLAAIAVVIESVGGYGGAVWPAAPGALRGAAFSFANPATPGAPAYPAGTLAAWAGLERSEADKYVKLRDVRDPDLRGSLTAAGRLRTGEYLELQGQARAGESCANAPAGVARSGGGELLSCQSGLWQQASSGGFGGAFSINHPRGCVQMSGQSTANPRTGACSCPPGYSAVLVSAGGAWDAEVGWTIGYICMR
ncbi:prepilin-type N-terminal cleavage/methylation domain-containing protein [Achromobacter sp. UMC71]|uniref:prepilin-type N-terminal cleavage/methylation domain-containing protein n=1 Tax=Achromobacter sp. UMC71 TaxID=1862320 RepID=UPI00160237E5|nr:prepilin-type N-terminal cleavage/methylation domain-containing protein [Achromobacter sp. UMC71]MBB1624986.1 prepilin [Achromobacter sp. UMC71]